MDDRIVFAEHLQHRRKLPIRLRIFFRLAWWYIGRETPTCPLCLTRGYKSHAKRCPFGNMFELFFGEH